MPIRFRCHACDQLLSIATRQAGAEVPCPRCGVGILVPQSGEAPQIAVATASKPSPSVPPQVVAAPRTIGAIGPPSDTPAEEPLRFRRRTAAGDEMDLTPMVDMTFLLLIFFMVTASFSQQKTLQVPPPDLDRKGATQTIDQLQDIERDSVRIEVDAANRISVEDEKLPNSTLLAETIREKMRTGLKSEALVTIDPRALHETAVRVVDACNEAGIQRIRLASRGAE